MVWGERPCRKKKKKKKKNCLVKVLSFSFSKISLGHFSLKRFLCSQSTQKWKIKTWHQNVSDSYKKNQFPGFRHESTVYQSDVHVNVNQLIILAFRSNVYLTNSRLILDIGILSLKPLYSSAILEKSFPYPKAAIIYNLYRNVTHAKGMFP